MEGILIFYLGIDNIKCTLFDENGIEKRTIEKEIELYTVDEYIEQNAEEWYLKVIEMLEEISINCPEIDVRSMSIIYQPGTFVCIDVSGKPIMNAIMQCDRRAKYQVYMFEKNIGKHYAYMSWSQMILPKILWIKYNKPNIYNKIFKILTPDAYISYRLSGEAAIDNCSAVFMGYNITSNCYNLKLLSNLGLDNKLLPKISRIGECIGIISGDIKNKLSIRSDIKILLLSSNLLPLSFLCSSIDENIFLYDIESSISCFVNKNAKVKISRNIIRMPINYNVIYNFIGNYELQFLKWIYKYFKNDKEPECCISSTNSSQPIVIPYFIGDSANENSNIKGSIININNVSSYNLITSTYESISYALKEKLDHISHFGVNCNSIEILSTISDRSLYQILSDIIGKKVYINRYDNVIKLAYNILMKINITKHTELDVIIPDDKKTPKYKHLFNMYRNAYGSINNIYKYKQRELK